MDKLPLIRGELVWEFDFEKVREVRPTPRMFEEFRRLHQKSDASILHFAKVWAPLRITADGKPEQARSGREPLHVWKDLSRRANAVMRLASQVKNKSRILEQDLLCISSPNNQPAQDLLGLGDWHRLSPIPLAEPTEHLSRSHKALHRVLAGEVSVWLKTFPVEFRMDAKPDFCWQVNFHYGGRLTSALALQLALSISGAHKLYVCSGCAQPYIRKDRVPNSGQANYCSDCKDGAEQARNRRTTERRRIARHMFKAGHNVEEIAEKIGVRKAESVLKMVRGVKADGKKTRSK